MMNIAAQSGQISTLMTARVLASDWLIVLGTVPNSQNPTFVSAWMQGALCLAEHMGETKAQPFLFTIAQQLDELDEELADRRDIHDELKLLVAMCQEVGS